VSRAPGASPGPFRSVLTPPLAVVVALAQERRALTDVLEAPRAGCVGEVRVTRGTLAGRSVHLLQAGVGAVRAGRASRDLLDRLPCAGLWSVGFAGGLTDALQRGDLVWADRLVRETDTGPAERRGEPAECVPVALRAAGLRAHTGAVLTAGAPLRTAAAKRAAHARTGAVAVEMEAAGVAEAAAARGVPWAALKVILDGVEDPLPEWTDGCTTPEGDLDLRGLGAALWAGGGALHALWRLGRAAAGARRVLGEGFRVAVRAALP
jgi:nucleoside phosphorylase